MGVMVLGLVLAVAFLPASYGQTLQLNNTSNSALDDPGYGADFVEGDSFLLTISGAAPNAPVTLLEWQNGISVAPTPYYWGNTDSSGNFQLSNTKAPSFIGTYVENWYVNAERRSETRSRSR